MQVIIIKCWIIKLLKTLCFCTRAMEINQWNVHCFTPVYYQHRWLKGHIYSSCYYHYQIGSIHLSHCYHIFPWLRDWDVCYITFCHLLHIHSRKTGNLFSLLLCNLWWVQIVGYVLPCRSYSFVCTVHHLIISLLLYYAKLSEDIELIKCLSDIFCRVCE